MIRQKHKQEMFAKPGPPGRKPALTSQAKNTTMHLDGQSLRLAPKNVRDFKTPGLPSSATHGGEEATAGQLTSTAASSTSREHQRDPLTFRSPVHGNPRESENLLPRRPPLKLAPLELPKDIREAQRQKIRGVQLDTGGRKQDLAAGGTKPYPRKAKACVTVREAPLKLALECPPLGAKTDTARSPQPKPKLSPSRGLFPRPSNVQPNGDGRHHDNDTTSTRAIPLPSVSSKPVPPSPGKARAARGGENARLNDAVLQPESTRKLRLRREGRLEEDQSKSCTSTTGGLSSEGVTTTAATAGCHGSRASRSDRALKEAARVLERAAKKNAAAQPQGSGRNMEVSGRGLRKMAAVSTSPSPEDAAP